MENQTKQVSVQLINDVLKYLSGRPAGEVYGLISELLKLGQTAEPATQVAAPSEQQAS